ncbi:MAG: hypothetical protein KDA89_15165, partial [Planctomycetaceae bacterium]|nr:hypothetical protein [Planctomycetaceae bacterium]
EAAGETDSVGSGPSTNGIRTAVVRWTKEEMTAVLAGSFNSAELSHRQTLTRPTAEPVKIVTTRPGRWGLLTGGAVIVLTLIASAQSRLRSNLPASGDTDSDASSRSNIRSFVRRHLSGSGILCGVIAVVTIADQVPQVDRHAAEQLAEYLLSRVYVCSLNQDERTAVGSLSDVLSEDLAEDVYLESLDVMNGDPESDLMVEVNDVSVRSLTPDSDRVERGRIDADCRWTVRGIVNHWGHSHVRMLSFDGKLRIEQQSEDWVISRFTSTDFHVELPAEQQFDQKASDFRNP